MRIDKEYKDRAKTENLALYSVMIDRRHISPRGTGYKHEEYGVMSLDKAAKIMAVLREDN